MGKWGAVDTKPSRENSPGGDMKPRTTSSESTVPVFVTVTWYDTRGAAAATTSLEGNLRPALEMSAKGACLRARVLDGEKEATDTSANDQLQPRQGWRV